MFYQSSPRFIIYLLGKIYLKTQMFLYSNDIRLQFQSNVSLTQLKYLIDGMKTTQQSCLETERVS